LTFGFNSGITELMTNISTYNASSADNQQERVPKNIDNLKYYLAGFIDGEGSFSVTICRSKFAKLKWKIDPLFQVYQHKDNSKILHIFKDVLGCGYVSEKGGNPICHVYCVDNIRDLLSIVIPFLEQYPLIGEKYNNFLLFKEIVISISKKEHLTSFGLIKLAEIAFRMNRLGKYRKNTLEDIINSLDQSSETIRRAPAQLEMI
jgi:hypothetical protein